MFRLTGAGRDRLRPRSWRPVVVRVAGNIVAPSHIGSVETGDSDALVRNAVRANVRVSANHLRHGSEVLEQLIQSDGLLVVGAEYSLETGVVDLFDDVPAAG